jgi:hypothetical protein
VKIDRFALVFIYLFVGFIVGFDIAWMLMKFPRVDMAMNTGVFIPIGLILAFISGVVRIYTNSIKMPQAVLTLFMLVFVILTLYTLVSLISNLKAASIVAPILVREGLNLRSLSITVIRRGTYIFLALGILSSVIYAFRTKLVGANLLERRK